MSKEKQEKFLEVLFSETCKGNVRKAMNVAGYADTYSPSRLTKSLAKEIEQATREFIASSTTTAAYTMHEIVTGKADALGLALRLQASKDLLDRGGHAKTEKVEIQSKDPLFILPAKKTNAEE